MDFVECGGSVHAYEERGPRQASGRMPSIVLVNALGTDHRIWDAVVSRLPESLRVVRYDQRGHGLSEVGETPYRIEALADDLAALVERLELGRPLVVGLSVGGLVAQALALGHPERVSGLCLCGTAAQIGTREAWSARMDQVRREGIRSVSAGVVERWFGPAFVAAHPERVRGFRLMLERAPVEGYLATIAALASADLRERVAGIEVPALVVSGELDAVVTPEQGRALSAAISGGASGKSEFCLLPGAAHLMSVDQPAALAGEILSFLERRLG